MLINCFWFLQSFDWFELGERKKTTRNKNNNINDTYNITVMLKRDFVKHKAAKANDEI